MTNTYPAKAAVRRNKRALPQASHRGATWHCSKQSAVLNELWFITWNPTEPVATRPLAIQKDGTWYTYGLDLPKNITEVYGTNGGIKTAYTYTPYGLVTSTGSVTQPLQWSSEYADTDLALVYYNYRHYNPLDGRWCGRDPMGIGGGYNLYAFLKGATYLTDFAGLIFLGAIANNRPIKNINVTKILIAGVVGAVIPGVGLKLASNLAKSFRSASKIGQMAPKATKCHKLVYSKRDIRYAEKLIENNRYVWSTFAYEAVQVTVYRQIGNKCGKIWCDMHNINDPAIKEEIIIITEKIRIEGEVIMSHMIPNSPHDDYPYFNLTPNYTPNKRYYLD